MQLPTFIIQFSKLGLPNHTTNLPNYNSSVPPGFLVWSPGCQIPSLDPLAADVMKLFEQEKYEECSSVKPLTSIRLNATKNEAYLVLNEKLRSTYEFKRHKIDCCYQEIIRSGIGKNADDRFK